MARIVESENKAARPLEPETKAAVAALVRYYRELGIYDFYRRGDVHYEGGESGTALHNSQETDATTLTLEDGVQAETGADPGAGDPVGKLRLIREDIGDCTRCKLHQQGRKQIVFGVGDPRADLIFIGEG